MEKIKSYLIGKIVSSNSKEAYSLNQQRNFGEKIEDKIHYTLPEALFLVEERKMDIYSKNKQLTKEELKKYLEKFDKKFWIKYLVFKDLRKKGYVVKTALKFGAEFRVYEKKADIKKTHSKWLVFTESESKKFNWHEFASKNRVAHSTKKNLLVAIVDEEGSILYYETSWIKP